MYPRRDADRRPVAAVELHQARQHGVEPLAHVGGQVGELVADPGRQSRCRSTGRAARAITRVGPTLAHMFLKSALCRIRLRSQSTRTPSSSAAPGTVTTLVSVVIMHVWPPAGTTISWRTMLP